MAFAMSLVALSIDAMLPAFPEMTRDLQLATVNDVQPVISVLFIGLALGQLFYGPLPDTTGRKPARSLARSLKRPGWLEISGSESWPSISRLRATASAIRSRYLDMERLSPVR